MTSAVRWRASGGGTQRFATIRKNNVLHDLAITQVAPVNSTGNFTAEIVSGQLLLAANDFIEVSVLQDSGADLNVVVGSTTQMTWISPAI